MTNPRIRSVRLNLCKVVLKAFFELGMGTHLPAYVTIVKDAGFNCANVCGRSIPKNPMTVAKWRGLYSLVSFRFATRVVVNSGSNSAPLLSALSGRVFFTPLLTFLRNGVW